MKQQDNVVFLKREKPLIDEAGNIDSRLDQISRHFLLSYAHDIQTYGVVELEGALDLLRYGVICFEEWSLEEHFKAFQVVKMTPEYVKCYNTHLDEIEDIPILNSEDPYLKSFVEGLPNELRFDGVYFMTERRLAQELGQGGRARLLYKTPYRPELGEDMMELFKK